MSEKNWEVALREAVVAAVNADMQSRAAYKKEVAKQFVHPQELFPSLADYVAGYLGARGLEDLCLVELLELSQQNPTNRKIFPRTGEEGLALASFLMGQRRDRRVYRLVASLLIGIGYDDRFSMESRLNALQYLLEISGRNAILARKLAQFARAWGSTFGRNIPRVRFFWG